VKGRYGRRFEIMTTIQQSDSRPLMRIYVKNIPGKLQTSSRYNRSFVLFKEVAPITKKEQQDEWRRSGD